MNMKHMYPFNTCYLRIENVCQSFLEVYFEGLGKSYIVFCLETIENFKNYSTMPQRI
jgi:hypothetical protein